MLAALTSIARDPSLGAHLARAGLAAALVWTFADPEQGNATAWALLAAGLALWSFDALEQSMHAVTASDGLRDPHRWSNATRQGALLAAVLLILLGVTPASVTGAMAGAAIVGAFWLVYTPTAAPETQNGWDTARPMTVQPVRRWLYHLWPAFSLGLVAAVVLRPQDSGWSPSYVMFQAAFLPFLLPLYPAKGPFLGSTPDRIRIAGLVLLVAGLWLNHA